MTTTKKPQTPTFSSGLNDQAATIAYADNLSAMLEGGAPMTPKASEGCRNLATVLEGYGTREASAAAERLIAASTR